ncbi:unnamed protein product [Sphagnum compactum]
MAEQRELDVTIISAQDLKNVTTFGKQSPFAVVWIHSSRKTTTPVATHGGVNPSWNAVVKVLCEQRLIDQGNGVMTIEILNKGSISNTQIGSVTVPLSQAIARDADKTSANQPKYMSFQVRSPSGKIKGVLNISMKLGNSRAAPQVAATQHGAAPTRTTAAAAAAAYPAVGYKQQQTGNLQYQQLYPPSVQYPAAQYAQGLQYPPQFAAAGQYPPPQYYAPPPPAYYPQAPVYVQQVQRPSGSGFGGGSGLGLGAGLLGGAVGGLLLGEALDGFDRGGGGCGGGGCGGGGCGGG